MKKRSIKIGLTVILTGILMIQSALMTAKAAEIPVADVYGQTLSGEEVYNMIMEGAAGDTFDFLGVVITSDLPAPIELMDITILGGEFLGSVVVNGNGAMIAEGTFRSGLTIQGNDAFLTNNKFIAASGDAPVKVSGAAGVQIEENTFSGEASHCIELTAGASAAISNNMFESRDSGDLDLPEVPAGKTIGIAADDGCTVTGHTIENSPEYYDSYPDGTRTIYLFGEKSYSLKVVKTSDPVTTGDTPAKVEPETAVIYTIQVTNDGEGQMEGIELRDEVPAGTTYQAGSAKIVAKPDGTAAAVSDESKTLRFTIDSLAAGESVTAAFTVTAPKKHDTTFTNQAAAVAATTGDTLYESNTVSHQVDASDVQGSEDTVLTAVKSSSPANVSSTPTTIAPGQIVTYYIEVKNDGLYPAENISVKDTLPAGTTYVSGSAKADRSDVDVIQLGSLVEFKVPSLDAGASVKVEFQVTAPTMHNSSFSNTASVVTSDKTIRTNTVSHKVVDSKVQGISDTNEDDSDTSKTKTTTKTAISKPNGGVRTGDEANAEGYLLALFAAAGVIGVCIKMRKR